MFPSTVSRFPSPLWLKAYVCFSSNQKDQNHRSVVVWKGKFDVYSVLDYVCPQLCGLTVDTQP